MATEGAVAEAQPPDLGDYAQFVSPAPTPTGGSPAPSPSPTPDLGDYAQFAGSPTPTPSDLGDYAQFVSPTPHASNALAQTNAVADQVDASTPTVAPYGLREDGTPKGKGFLGPLKRPDGQVSSELSIGVNLDGKETLIPSLVPTLSQDEVNSLLNMPKGQMPSPQIVAKAADYARGRIAQGKSPFAGEGEQGRLPIIPRSGTQFDVEEMRQYAEMGPPEGSLLTLPKATINETDSIGIKANKAIYNTAAGFVEGATSAGGIHMMLNPVITAVGIGKMVPGLIERVQAAQKTPPFSAERFQAASDVTAFVALPAVAHALTRGGEPNASKVTSPESIPVPEVRQGVGGEASLRQQGETTGARPVEQPVEQAQVGAQEIAYSYLTPEAEAWWKKAEKLRAAYHATKPHSPERAEARKAFREHEELTLGKGNRYSRYDSDGYEISSSTIHLGENAKEAESAVRQAPVGAEEIAPSQLVPALRTQSGEIVPGQKGQTHAELYPSLPDEAKMALAEDIKPEHGFVMPEQPANFFPRARAGAAVGHTGPGEFQSEDLIRMQAEEAASQPVTGGGAAPEAAPSTQGQGGAAPLSIGAASPEEFMQRYASIGASHILRGTTEEGAFARAVESDIGSHIRDQIPEIRARSEALINEMQTSTGKTDVTQEVNRLVGVTKLVEQPARVRLFTALKESLARAERAGKAGFKRGFQEAEAIGEVQVKEAEAAGKAKVKEAEAAGKKKLQEARAKARTTDDWLAADQAEVRQMLLDYSKNLPLNQRGKFLSAITDATRRVPLAGRDPAVIYRRAETVLNRMTEALYNVELRQAKIDIAARLKKIEDSPSVSVGQKQAARQIANTFNNLKDRMSFDMLERMHQQIMGIEQTGRDLVVLNQTMRDLRTKLENAEIQKEGTLKLDKATPAYVPIGQELSLAQRQVAMVARIPSGSRHFNLSWTPMDFVFQVFDRKFNGALYRLMKLPIDMKFSQYLDIARGYKDVLRKIVDQNQNNLKDGNLNRINAVAELRQEGGLENLMSRGYTEAELKSIRLTKPELEYLRNSDKILAELLPRIREVLKNEFNEEIPDIKGYWPRQRDWDFYNSLSITEGKFSSAMRRVTPEKGHTIARTGAVTKNIMNAHEIMMKAIDDEVYHMVMAPEIRRVADLIKTEEFRNQVGTWGQQVFADWLDVVARNGGIEANRRIPAVDVIRKNVGMAQLAWRITTTGLQPLSIFDGMSYVSPKSMGRSLTRMMSPENRQFILDNFPEVRERVGDDPAYSDYGGTGTNIVGRGRDWLARAGFHAISMLDRFAAMTVADGAYRDYLIDHGLNPDAYYQTVHMDAMHYSQLIVRKSQSSALPKDLPLATSRGGFSGNASVDKMIGQFQTFMIRRWSTLKHDALQMGMKEKSVKSGARVMSFIVLATVMEQLGREGIRALTRTIVGESSRDKKRRETQPAIAQRVAQNSAVDFVTSIPVVSNVVGAIKYGGTGVPIVDVAMKAGAGIPQMVTGSSAYSRGIGAVRTAQAVGALTGVLPTGQAGDLIIKWIQSAEAESKGHRFRPVPRPKSGPGVVKSKPVK